MCRGILKAGGRHEGGERAKLSKPGPCEGADGLSIVPRRRGGKEEGQHSTGLGAQAAGSLAWHGNMIARGMERSRHPVRSSESACPVHEGIRLSAAAIGTVFM